MESLREELRNLEIKARKYDELTEKYDTMTEALKKAWDELGEVIKTHAKPEHKIKIMIRNAGNKPNNKAEILKKLEDGEILTIQDIIKICGYFKYSQGYHIFKELQRIKGVCVGQKSGQIREKTLFYQPAGMIIKQK